MVELKQRGLDEVKALGKDEAVEIMRQAGIVGAGGGGFPTYFKYKNPQPMLLVNATESEPGYWADKVVHRRYLDRFLRLFEAMKAIFGIEQIRMGVHEKDREWFADYAERADGLFDMAYVPDKYALGEEKTLIKHATDKRVPRRVEMPGGSRRPGLPLDVGIIVNNTETLLNVYNALFLGRPVTTKFLQVFGPELELKVYEVPIGASVAEVVGIAGVDVENSHHLCVIDGGPYLNEMGIEELGEGDAYVRRTTNGLFLIPKDKPSKEYAGIKTRTPEQGIVSLAGRVSGVHVPLGGRFLTPATTLVAQGEEVEYGQKVGEPVDEGFSIGVWASAEGIVSSVEDEVVAISGSGASLRGEAEAPGELRGGDRPRASKHSGKGRVAVGAVGDGANSKVGEEPTG
jgi:Na+-translocating ferredoxin:NAD+ oxidoreductase RnfC subunit